MAKKDTVFDFRVEIGKPDRNGRTIDKETWSNVVNSEKFYKLLRNQKIRVNIPYFKNNTTIIPTKQRDIGSIISVGERGAVATVDECYSATDYYIAPTCIIESITENKVIRISNIAYFSLIEKSRFKEMEDMIEVKRSGNEARFLPFKVAYEALKKGFKIKRSSWKGYWKWENNTIMMHCKNGEVINFLDTEGLDYTLSNTLASDWIILDEDEISDSELNIQTMKFGEALRNLKLGKKISRTGWKNNDGFQRYLEYDAKSIWEPIKLISFDSVNNVESGAQHPYMITYDDILATDWIIVE